jgi:AcrR family transcriptional regulator
MRENWLMSSPGLRERKKQKTRWAIQEHALRLFAQHGFEATTVEQIAEAAEISPSTFFRYFKTKEDVVAEDRYDEMIVSAIEATPPEVSPFETLRRALVGSIEQIEAAEFEQILLRMRLTFSVPALRARSLSNLISAADVFAPPLARRIGRDPDDLQLRAFVTGMMAAAGSAVIAWSESGGATNLAEVTDKALTALVEFSSP